MQLYNLASTQADVAKDIENSFNDGFLPQSLLFSGARGTSRLTGALDLSFMLLEKEAKDNNSNVNTSWQRKRNLLSTSQIVFLPARNLYSEFKATLTLFSNLRTDRARVFLLQAVRKILLEYHSSLVNSYDKKISSYFSQAEEIGAFLYDYEESRDYSEKEIKNLVAFLQKNVTQAFINKGRKSSTVSIDEIRGIQDWFSSGSDEKIAILENVEDSTEGAKNSLLKVLEEPMPHAHIILVSANSQKLLQTILSRTRRFNFPTLTEKQVSKFLRDYFNLYEDYSSFEGFFFQEGADKEEKTLLDSSVETFSAVIASRSKTLTNDEKENLFSSIDKINSYHYFLQCVTDRISRMLREDKLKPIEAKERMDIINRWIINSEIYNLSARASLDGILREVQSVK